MSINEVESKTQAKVHVPLATRFLTKMLKMFTGEKTASLADGGAGNTGQGGPREIAKLLDCKGDWE